MRVLKLKSYTSIYTSKRTGIMLFTTQLELNITIKDVNAIYSTDYDQMLLDHAKLMYQGKCSDGQYVKSIDRIVKRSLPNLIQRDLNTKIRVFAMVEAKVIRYDQYDFITGMKVTKIIPSGKIGAFDMVECRNDHVCALMRVQKDIESFKVGDVIPIRVGESMYKIGNAHILVNGYPFLPYVPDRVVYSIGKLLPDAKKYFNEMIMPLIQRELSRKDACDKDIWNKFSNLLHPFKKEEEPKKMIDITNIESIENGTFGINPKVNMKHMKISNSKESASIVYDDSKTALTRIMFEFVKWIETINDLCEQYPTNDAFNSMKHVWDLYEQHKF